MKALFFTLLFFGAAFAAYDYFGAPVGEKIIFTDLNKVTATEETAYSTPAPNSDEPPREIPPIPQDMPAPAKPAETKPVADAPPPPASDEPKADASGFTPPKYDTLDTLTKGWTFIPATAFPRPVHINKMVPFKMSVGSSNMNAGAEVTALAFSNGMLQLAPTAASTARAVVPVDDTDLKAVLQSGYENWKTLRTAALKRAHERRLANQSAAPTATPTAATDPAVPPERASDGSYPLLVAHLNSGEVTEVKAKNIHQWGTAETMMFEGKSAWSIKVQVDVDTVFGKQPAEVQCIVASGRVKGWFYTGSGEPVP